MAKLTDIEISRRLPEIARKLDKIITRELGEQHLFAFVLQPWGVQGDDTPRGMQYIGNAPREFMQEAFRKIVAQWDAHPDMPDIAPHLKQ